MSGGPVSLLGFDPTAPAPGEPTGHVVVRTAREIPESIVGHAMYHHGPGVMRHARLGIWVIVLDEIDPERSGRKMLQALGDLGIARERLAKVERERDATGAVALDYARERDEREAERDQARAELERAAMEHMNLEAGHTYAVRVANRYLTPADAADIRRRGEAIGVQLLVLAGDLTIDGAPAVDALRAERGRLRVWLAEVLDGIRGHCGEDHGSSGCLHELEDRIRREAGLT